MAISHERTRVREDAPDLRLFDVTGKGMFALDLADDGRIVAVGAMGAALLGIDRDDLVGRLPAEAFPVGVAQAAHDCATLPTFPTRVIQTTLPTRLVSDRTVEWTLHGLAAGAGRVALLEANDVTIRKRNDNRLRNMARAVEQSPISVVITDVRGVIEYVNPRFTHVTGYGYDEAIGTTPSIVKSGFTSPQQYRELWETITAGREWRGELLNRRKNGDLFWEHISISPIRDETGAIVRFVAVKEDVTMRKEYEKRLLYQAHYDDLTKLPNRLLSIDRLTQALARADRNREHVGVAFIDLDNFKKVNDTLGHTYGDDLLRIAARRLVGCIRASDTVGRLGGDEFLIVLPDLHDPAHALSVADKILEAFQEPFLILGHSITTTASVGLTIFPGDGREANILLRNADAAMYRAKDAGRNCCRTFHAGLNAITMHRLRLESLLSGALDRGEIFVVYQPQVDTRTGRLIGAEALARWRSPELGMVSPLDFVPLAEDSGLIEQIGRYVLETACQQLARWRDRLPPGTRVGVNVSPRQVAVPGFADVVEKALADAGLPTHCLEIELTESLFALRVATVVETLNALRAMGVRLAVDDFGTGYSSLSYLREFPVNTVKIDRSFMIPVGDEAADSLVRAIVTMGHSLGLQVVGEGIETAQQLAFLQDVGCDAVQGYFVSKPLSADAFLRFATRA
ncbi:conserved hypothetical protein [uncultured Alphaproteobacteria bacterium]|uniref:Diguanylate cyclase n=1 Tax=uncultured Alphaproteobacteria bacterium TaxID=91750 RepID=A0A212JAY2_9PROT|nr:conserved hypothetical protein [uncultured Alphaproteobacteria bacterium]